MRARGAEPNDLAVTQMRALVLGGQCGTWEATPRSAAELKEATTHYDRAAALSALLAPAAKAELVELADLCRSHRQGPCRAVL